MQLFANDFRVRPKVWKNNITRNSSRSVILTLLTLLSAVQNQLYFWGFPHYPKLEYAISRCYIFPNGYVWFIDNFLCLSDVWKGRSYVNANVSVSVSSIFSSCEFYLMHCFLRHRNSPLKRFNCVSIATPLFSVFIQQNTKSTTGTNIYSFPEELPKALIEMFLIEVNRLTLPRSSQDVIFKHIFKDAFL